MIETPKPSSEKQPIPAYSLEAFKNDIPQNYRYLFLTQSASLLTQEENKPYLRVVQKADSPHNILNQKDKYYEELNQQGKPVTSVADVMNKFSDLASKTDKDCVLTVTNPIGLGGVHPEISRAVLFSTVRFLSMYEIMNEAHERGNTAKLAQLEKELSDLSKGGKTTGELRYIYTINWLLSQIRGNKDNPAAVANYSKKLDDIGESDEPDQKAPVTHDEKEQKEQVVSPPSVEVMEDVQPVVQEPNEPSQKDERGEDSEFEQEKARAIHILHDFFQAQKKNTPAHNKMSQLIEEMSKVTYEALPLIKVMVESQSDPEVLSDFRVEEWQFPWSDGCEEIVVSWYDADVKSRMSFDQPIRMLQTLQEQKKYATDQTLARLITTYEKTTRDIADTRKALWKEKEKIVDELLSIGFENWRNAERTKKSQGLYDMDGFIEMRRVNFTDTGEEKTSTTFFTKGLFGESLLYDVEKGLTAIQEKFHISPEEFQEMTRLEWSPEDKPKIEQLKQSMEVLSDEKITEVVRDDYANFGGVFTENSIHIIATECKRAMIRALYRQYELPTHLEDRVITEIMLGTFFD